MKRGIGYGWAGFNMHESSKLINPRIFNKILIVKIIVLKTTLFSFDHNILIFWQEGDEALIYSLQNFIYIVLLRSSSKLEMSNSKSLARRWLKLNPWSIDLTFQCQKRIVKLSMWNDYFASKHAFKSMIIGGSPETVIYCSEFFVTWKPWPRAHFS